MNKALYAFAAAIVLASVMFALSNRYVIKAVQTEVVRFDRWTGRTWTLADKWYLREG